MGISKTRVWNFGSGYGTKNYLRQTYFSYISYLSLKYLEVPNKVMPLTMAYLVSKYSTARITSSLLMQLSSLLKLNREAYKNNPYIIIISPE
jgi:hypothetical protein